jgi:hypothetical protein
MTDQPTYQPEADYDLQVSRPVKIGSFKYLPRHQVAAKGSLINMIIEQEGEDAIRSAVAR